MPAIVLPQLLLSGLFVARRDGAVAQWVADALPLVYAYDALNRVAGGTGYGPRFAADVVVTIGAAILALLFGAATLRRRTP
jgi:ABC-2 type transport system permease protein